MNKKPKFVPLKKILNLNVVLFLFTLFILPWYGLLFNKNRKVLFHKNDYKAQQLIVKDTYYISTGNTGRPVGKVLHGFINQKKKRLDVSRNSNISIGDTVLVWSNDLREIVIKRFPSETHSDFVKLYQKKQRNTIIFVFVPYVLLWLTFIIRIKKK